MMDKNLLMLRALSLVEQDEEDVIALYDGANANEVFQDYLGIFAVAKALMDILSDVTGVPTVEILTRTRSRIVALMPPPPDN